jgi:hypothetical protein
MTAQALPSNPQPRFASSDLFQIATLDGERCWLPETDRTRAR